MKEKLGILLTLLSIVLFGVIFGVLLFGAAMDSTFKVKTESYTAYFVPSSDPCSRSIAWNDVMNDGLVSAILRRNAHASIVNGYNNSVCERQIGENQ